MQRHIDNPKIHGGYARAITFTEYSSGIITGKYKVGQKPRFGSLEQPLLIRLDRKIRFEIENEIAKEVAKRVCNNIDDSFYNSIGAIVSKHIEIKQYKETFGHEL